MMFLVKAAVMRQGQIVVDEVDDPRPGDDEALVATVACGICGSDLHALTHGDQMVEMQRRTGGGVSRMDLDRDLVMGHEFCAEVLEFGPGDQGRAKVGDLVVSLPVLVSGGRLRPIGYSNDIGGGYAEQMLLSSSLLLPVPNGLAAEHAALTEPMAVGRHAVEASQVTSDDAVLVVGCGPVGLAVIAALKQKGLGPVVAADFAPGRRELAEALGADEVIDPAVTSPYQRWQDLARSASTEGREPLMRMGGSSTNPGVIFECVGVPGVLDQVMAGAMRHTRIVVVGVCMEADVVYPMMGITKELNLQFVLGYTPAEFADTLRGLAEGELPSQQLITGHVDLDGVAGAFADLAEPGRHAKIMVEPGR
jgi:threonine dehydrogenase-like Zn-dependent dehydrogenase